MGRSFFMVVCLLMLTTQPALAASYQYPDPNRQTIWNNLTDSLHTWGQPPFKAKRIRQQLHIKRRIERQNSINRARRQAWLQRIQSQNQ